MGTPFKIPKKKQPSCSSVLHMTSPLSRLRDDLSVKSSWNHHNGQKVNGSTSVNGRREMKPGSTGENRWRPKRASDKLCECENDKYTPAAKKQWGSGLGGKRMSPQSADKDESEKMKGTTPPLRETKSPSAHQPVVTGVTDRRNGLCTRPSPQTRTEVLQVKYMKTPKDASAVSGPIQKSAKDALKTRRKLQLQLSLRTYQRIKASSSEPIVLSSGDEEDSEPHSDVRLNLHLREKKTENTISEGRSLSPAIVELSFSSLYFGTTQSHANGPIMITEDSISMQLKGMDVDGGDGECLSVCVVPSELRAYGMWDAVGSGFMEQRDSSSSFLFFTLSDAQARLLNTELSTLHKPTAASPCPFVLVHLIDRLNELQQATLASLMETMALRSGHPSLGTPVSREEGLKRVLCHPHSAQFLSMLGNKATDQSHKSPNSGKVPEVTNARHPLCSRLRQPSMPRRLIQYPPPPSKGGITVTAEDLECLRDGEFLNDVIIDFYLKFLQLERTDPDVANRSHIFSSFFYKQLTRKANSTEGEAGDTAQYRRHGRVRTWTRNVDIFSKDYLFIPVNQEAHWYLVVICFPGLLQPECVLWKKIQTGSSGDPGGKSTDVALKSNNLPDCTTLTCQRNIITRRPCILIMDSLKLSCHSRVYTLLQEYLQVEWEVRRGTPRLFNSSNIRGSHCKVPLQDNSSDCGLYLLQYVESFLQSPVVHFDLPLRLERWFPRQQVRRKRAELRELVLQLCQKQVGGVI